MAKLFSYLFALLRRAESRAIADAESILKPITSIHAKLVKVQTDATAAAHRATAMANAMVQKASAAAAAAEKIGTLIGK
jgi:hypothetical protein